MANERQIVDAFQNTVGGSPEVAFTSPSNGAGTLITHVVASNDTTQDQVYQAFIVSDDTAGTLPQVPLRTIVTKKTDVPAELAGQVIPAGGTLQFESGSALTNAFTVSGRNLT